LISFAGSIARGAYGPAKEIKKHPKDEARLYENNPKLRLFIFYPPQHFLAMRGI
jgi:hypothetical protein